MKKLTALAVCVSLASAGLLAPALTANATESTTSETTSETTTSETTTTPETFQQKAERVISAAALTEDQKAKLLALAQAVPADWEQRLAALNAKLGIHETEWAEIAASVINPEDYTCAPTPLRDWAVEQRQSWSLFGEILFELFALGDMATYDALLFGSDSKANVYGTNGEYTSLLTAEKKDLREFWGIERGEIELRPMHGNIYDDKEHLARLLDVLYGPGLGVELAPLFDEIFALAPEFQRGDSPLFSFNAFALDPTGNPALQELGITKKMIVMGDGIMEALAGIGLDEKVGPRAILAHEYGHQIQFAKHLFDSPLTGAEATRRTELMADAFGTYFMVHSRGEALNAARTLADQKSFFNVGDCSFDSNGHHGTPNQRFNSAAWAVDVVKQAANQGIIAQLGGSELASKFDAKLPELVAPDAP